MKQFIKRNIFKIAECSAEFILYVPWMVYSYYFTLQNRFIATKYLPFFFGFMMMGLAVTDILLQKRGVIYRAVAYVIGVTPVAIIALIMMSNHSNIFLVAMFSAFSLISYIRGVIFAQRNFRTMYGESKLIAGIVLSFIAYMISALYKGLNWFESTVICLAIVFIALSMIILNQLQLLQMFDLMNAESVASHRDVRTRNLLFSAVSAGFIVLIFYFKYMVRFLSAFSVYIGFAIKYIVVWILRWAISRLNGPQSNGIQQPPASSLNIEMLQDKSVPHWVTIIKAILEYALYALAVVILAIIVYNLIKALVKWISAFMKEYMYREDEERNFIFSWEDIIVRHGERLRRTVSRRIRRIKRQFKTPAEHLRFLYRESVHCLIVKGGYHNIIMPSSTPDEIHRDIKNLLPTVDPDLEKLTALYKKARYSNSTITDDDVKESKRHRDKLVKKIRLRRV